MKCLSSFCAGVIVAGLLVLSDCSLALAAPQLGYRVARAIAGPMDLMPARKGPSLFANRQQVPAGEAVTASQPNPAPQAQETQSTVASHFADNYDVEDNCDVLTCGPSERFWLRADYLMWWTSGTQLPALVTDGLLETPGTNVLYGDGLVGTEGRSGYRTTIGMWLGSCKNWGLELDYLDLGQQESRYSASSMGDIVLLRPFNDLLSNRQSAYAVAGPTGLAGTVSVDAREYFQSAGALLTRNILGGACCAGLCEDECDVALSPRVDLLMGFRYYNLNDSVSIRQSTLAVDTNDLFQLDDSFRARNEFYGSEVGFRTRFQRCRWSLEFLTKVAVGNTHETVTINGASLYTPAQGASQPFDAGLLAVGSNSRTYQRDVFTMIPQLGVELGYEVSCHWRAFVGYNLLYWGAVRRAADQIDLNIDMRNVPLSNDYDPTAAIGYPAYLDRSGAFWAQGVNVGTEFRF